MGRETSHNDSAASSNHGSKPVLATCIDYYIKESDCSLPKVFFVAHNVSAIEPSSTAVRLLDIVVAAVR